MRNPVPSLSVVAALVGLALGTASCVRRDIYEEAIASLHQAKNAGMESSAKAAALEAKLAGLQAEVASIGQSATARDAKLADLSVTASNQSKKIDDLVALNDELSRRLKAAGQSVSAIESERGTLATALADTRARLEELRKQQAAADARAGQFRDLVARFQKLIDAGKLKVTVRGGRMLIELPNDVLFDSGKTDLKPEGKKTLGEIGGVLKTMRDRMFQVAGHTDNVKIMGGRFASNWELSTARAVEVTKLLIESGMAPKTLSAAGYGEFTPAGPNDTAEGRAKNRRIEITLVPNLEEFVKLTAPEVIGGGAAAKKP